MLRRGTVCRLARSSNADGLRGSPRYGALDVPHETSGYDLFTNLLPLGLYLGVGDFVWKVRWPTLEAPLSVAATPIAVTNGSFEVVCRETRNSTYQLADLNV